MAESMIERIARVLCAREGGDPDEVRHGEGHAAGQTWLGWQVYATDARAVLAGMREPTEAMVDKAGDRDTLGWDPAPRSVWQAMIDAAMKEGQ